MELIFYLQVDIVERERYVCPCVSRLFYRIPLCSKSCTPN